MNERLEQLSFEMFPQIWEPIGGYILGHERDVNYEQRQKWLEGAKKIYNLALADVREMITRQQKANHTGTDEWIRAKSIAYESVCDFINNLTK